MNNSTYYLGKYHSDNVIYDINRAMNGHICLLGKSGSGKTTKAEKLCLEKVKAGKTVLMIDSNQTLAESEIFPPIREEFLSYVRAIDAYESGIPCPLFDPVTFEDGVKEYEHDTVCSITEIFCQAYGLRVKERASLRKAIENVMRDGLYHQLGIKAIGEQLATSSIHAGKGVLEKMQPILNHNIFRDGELFISPEKINIVKISHFDLDTQKVISELLLSKLLRLAVTGYFKTSPISLFVDEIQNLSLSKTHALSKLLTEGRRLGINLILATQFLPRDSADAQRILQSALTLYFMPARNKLREVASNIDSSRIDDWAHLLSGMKQGEFVAVGPMLVGDRKTDGPILISDNETFGSVSE